MKKLFFLLLLCILGALPLVAQEQDFSEEEFRQKIDSVFQYVDLKQVETGILIEHGFNLLDPKAFNGQKPDSVYTNKEILKALYAGLYDSEVNNYSIMEDTEVIFPKIDNNENLTVLYYAVNSLSDNAIRRGQLYMENEQLNINYGNWGDVFDWDHCFAVALGRDEFYGKDVTIPITIGKYFSNSGYSIAEIEIKADNGAYEKVAVNSDWKHSFSQLGEHWLGFRITFKDGYIMECRTPITLLEPKSQQVSPFDKPIETFSVIAADSEQSGGELQVIYLNKEKTKGKFVRPLVIAGDINLSGLLTGGEATPIDLKTIGTTSGIGGKLAELSQIYDIIYLKYNNDMDDLLRNGKLLRKALQTVNENRFTVSDDTYVVGLGVGGVIARIGINMMESAGENHRVCKFIAVNSPFRGLNIPLSLQALMRNITKFPRIVKKRIPDLVGKSQKFNNYINRVIMTSLLIQRIDDKDECSNLLNNNWLAINQKYFVKPRKCQTVAIVLNGNQNILRVELFNIKGSKSAGIGNFSVDLKGYDSKSEGLVYKGKTKLSIIGIGKAKEFNINGNNSVLPMDQCYGSKMSILPLKNLTDVVKINIDCPNVTFIPCYSALDMSKSEYDAITNHSNISSDKFDRCAVVNTNSNYPDYSPMMSALAYELLPHIEGADL